MGSSIQSAHIYRLRSALRGRWVALALALCWGIGATLGGAPVAAAVPASGGGGNAPNLVISSPNPPSGPATTNLVVSGAHWNPNETVTLAIGAADGTCATTTHVPTGDPTGTPDSTGAVQIVFAWPTTLPNGTYPICGSSATISTIKTSNGFVSLSQSTPTLVLPTTGASGATVAVSGTNWLPAGTQVEIHWGPSGTSGCATLLTTLTSAADGSLNGTISLPSFAANTSIVVAATSPAGSCGEQSPPPSLVKTATIAVTGTGASATPTPGTGTKTPTPGGTPTPIATTPTPGTGHLTPTPTPHGGGGGGGGSGPCPPLPGSFCSTNSSFPWWLCLVLLGLFLLFLIVLLVLISRRNQQMVVQEEDITSQINPASVAPMGSMRFVRAVRVTNQVIDKGSGRVLNSHARDYDEFVDSSSNTHRRPRS